MKRTSLRTKDVQKLLEKYPLALQKTDRIELLENEFKLIIINQIPAFFYYQDQLIPTLKYLQQHALLKKITVDKGAIKFIIGGADVMRPGIIEIEAGINKNDLAVVIDQDNKTPLAVGIALLNSEEITKSTSGKMVKNIHHLGDPIWNLKV